ncbi:uncharacterized protein CANTADRAFT_219769 [Suhomyces tanzawaensis NRRL Y-17324]|uniref:Uncharacterized protein n=1 Tax=Suhomyces tanzawaensis NRRL Y-17324 TaxID=984487 RepID=A0A1E4SKC3_9ASCO|nr:uncharacterized protein CANTADRAFT_219769 [Suhomyces tanzawaensis NRRL Y-17324]ODV79948.1 hypothetical protein CANTADRAFT_219769 [Suhomyces tanzawaensis NRRL Y-17324]
MLLLAAPVEKCEPPASWTFLPAAHAGASMLGPRPHRSRAAMSPAPAEPAIVVTEASLQIGVGSDSDRTCQKTRILEAARGVAVEVFGGEGPGSAEECGSGPNVVLANILIPHRTTDTSRGTTLGLAVLDYSQ